MWACPVRNWISLLKFLWSKSLNQLVRLSVGGKVFVGWKPELGCVWWLFHLWVHASSISLLWREAMNACVLRSHCVGHCFAPSLVRQSTSSLPGMFECPGTQLMVTSASFTEFKISAMCFLKARECS